MGGLTFNIVFYGISAVMIAALLVRMWFKNRAVTNPPPKRPIPVKPVIANSPVPPLVPLVPLVPPQQSVPPESLVLPVPTPQSEVVPEVVVPIEPQPVVPAPAPVWELDEPEHDLGRGPIRGPAPYIPSESSTILRSPEIPTWVDRRLLEDASAGKKKPVMPRVLAAEVPGIADDDRTFGKELNPVLASLLPESDERREAARKELLAAGYHNPHAIENLAAIRYVLMMLGILVFGGLLLIVPKRLEAWAIAGLVLGPGLGWALPMLHIRRKAAERMREISRAMPDLLDMLNMCVSQGLTVMDSLKRILRDFRGVYPALAQELSIVTEQAQINDMHTALENFGRRIDLPEVHSFTSLLVQTERMGTSISDALTTYSDTMRESLKQRADEKGNQATFRLLFPTVLCLMPAVYLFLLGPAVNEMSKFLSRGGREGLDTGARAIQNLYQQRGARR